MKLVSPAPALPAAIRVELAAGIKPIELIVALKYSGLDVTIDEERGVLVIDRRPPPRRAA